MTKEIKVLIIGSGQIGSRHLQGFLKSNHKLSITMVDPNVKSLQNSKFRAKEIKCGNPNSTVHYKQKTPKNEKFKICIISTNADVRAEVAKSLLTNCLIENLIFEKILFQLDSDYRLVSKLLKKNQTSAWVNCNKRMVPFYKNIKKSLDLKKCVKMYIEGSSWGMACNSIHFIDLFSYFVNSSNLKILKTNFTNRLFESHRGKNFYEVNGLMECMIENHTLKISCDNKRKPFWFVKIINSKNEFHIDELKGEYKTILNKYTKTQINPYPNQSNLSLKLINDLIEHNNCELVKYEDSCKLHIPLILEIRTHLSKLLKKKLVQCPIT